MKHLLEVIAKALVDQPDKVTVTEKETARMKSLSVRSRKAEPQYWNFMLQKATWEK